MLLLALYKSQRHSNTLLYLKKIKHFDFHLKLEFCQMTKKTFGAVTLCRKILDLQAVYDNNHNA
jgi:uncharacterized protein YcgL (UPF0745 family)